MLPLVRGRSLALEMTGYGSSISDGQGRDLGLAAQADRLLRWLDLVGIDAPVLVGHDLGGGVAQIAAVRAPGRFSGLVLTNAVCYDSWPIPSVKAMQRAAPLLRYLPESALYPSFVQLIHRGHDDPGPGAGVDRRALAALRHPRRRTQPHAPGQRPTGRGHPRCRRPAALARPAGPCGVGEGDQFQKVEYGRRLAADLGTTLQPISGGKHFTPEDHPEAIAAAVNELLGSRPAGPDSTGPAPEQGGPGGR